MTNETWRRDLLAAPRSQANQIIDLQQDVGWQIEDLKNRGLIENLGQQRDFLRTFQPGQRLNLYDQPASPREALRNQIINQQVQGQDRLLRSGIASYPQRLKDYANQLALARQQQQMGLERAKFGQQVRRDRANQGLAAQRFMLDTRKAQAQDQYRNRALQQSGAIARQRLQAMEARDMDREYDEDYKEARDAVLSGMAPEEAADLFGLDVEDVPRLEGYADIVAQDYAMEDAQANQIAEVLNAQEMALRQKKPRADVPGQYTPLPTLSTAERAPLLESMIKMGGAGFVQPRGTSGFAPVQQSRAKVDARVPQFPELWYRQMQRLGPDSKYPGVPVVLTPEQHASLPIGARYVAPDGKLKVKTR